MNLITLLLLFCSFLYSFLYPQSPGVHFFWGLTVLFLFLNRRKVYYFLPGYFFAPLLLVLIFLFYYFHPFYLTFASFFAFYLLFWFLTVYSFTSSTPRLFILTVIVNLLFLFFHGGQVVLWYILTIETLFFYLFLKQREKTPPSRVFILFFIILFFLIGYWLDLFFPDDISRKSILYFALWFSLQLPIGLKPTNRIFLFLRLFLIAGIVLFWNSPLYEKPLFWLFLLLVHYPRPSVTRYRREKIFFAKSACILGLFLLMYFHLGFFIHQMYLKKIPDLPNNIKVHFYISRVFAYFSAEHYHYWINTMRKYALDKKEEEYKQHTSFFQKRLLNLEPTANNYLMAARTEADFNNFSRACDYYQQALLLSSFRKDILKEFLIFLEIHSEFPGALELRSKLIQYGYKLHPQEPYFIQQMILLRKGALL